MIVAQMRGAQFVMSSIFVRLYPAEAADAKIARQALVDVADDLGYEDEDDYLMALNQVGSAIVKYFPTD